MKHTALLFSGNMGGGSTRPFDDFFKSRPVDFNGHGVLISYHFILKMPGEGSRVKTIIRITKQTKGPAHDTERPIG